MPTADVCQEPDAQTTRPSETPPQQPRVQQRNIDRYANFPASEPSNDDAINAAKTAQQLAEAQKAAADAQKARAEAELAAFKAAMGEVPASSYKGNVELKDGAGKTEAYLLSAKAVQEAAQKIATHLPKQTGTKFVLLYPSKDLPTFQALLTFRTQVSTIRNVLISATNASNANNTLPGVPTPPRIAAAVGGVGIALQTLDNLLSYFRTDYSVGGVEITLDESLLVHALAGSMQSSGKNFQVILPATYNPQAFDFVITSITDLVNLAGEAQKAADLQATLAVQLINLANLAANPAQKADLLSQADHHKALSDRCKAAVTLADGYIAKLVAPDDKGIAPLASVLREEAVADFLRKADKGNMLLIAKLQQAGGGYYTKKNMWTFWGGMPFYNMGGVVVSYVLINGADGVVLDAGVVPVDGGYVKADRLPEVINQPPK